MSDDRPLRDRVAVPNTGAVVRTVIRLGIACLIVGGLLAVLNINPIELWKGLANAIERGVVDIFGTGIDGISLILTLIATGAVVVLPIWLIGKLLGSRRR